VAATPFLELDDDIKGRIAVDADEVGRLNPQCGDMRQLHHLALYDPETGLAVGVKFVRDDEFWVPLHIPGRPLYPGVLMIEGAAQLASVYYRKKAGESRFLGFARCDNVVFRGQVTPGETLYFISNEVLFSPRRFVSDLQGIVDGRLVFEARITGMPM